MSGIFISHSSKDKSFVTKLAIDLVNRGLPVWFDTWEMDTGDSLIDKIYKGVDESTYFIVILSPNSVNSRWVQKELNGALTKEETLQRRFLIPIKMAECDVPLSIADRIYADFTDSYLTALEKLIASLEKANLHKTAISPENRLIPLVFTKGIYLNEPLLERCINSFLPSIPTDFRFNKNQFVISPDEKYKLLRERLLFRIEHIEEDPYYTPQLEKELYQFYHSVIKWEENLIEGIQLIINELAIARRNSHFPFSTSCHWFARLCRAYILGTLWFCQSPALSDISDYGKEFATASSEMITKLLEIDSPKKFDIGYFPDNQNWWKKSFSVYLKETSRVRRTLSEDPYPVNLRYEVDSYDIAQLVIPQMLYTYFLGYYSDITWDFEDYRIGLA